MSGDKRTGNRFEALATLGSSEPRTPKKKVDALFGGAYSGHQLGQMRKKMAELYPDHPKAERAPRELEGRALKRLGKELGNASYIARGRKLQYGHLTPEQLLTQHPSAFLRSNTIRAGFLQNSDVALSERSSEGGFSEGAAHRRTFHLISNRGSEALAYSGVHQSDQILDSRTGKTQARHADFNLVQDSRKSQVEDAFGKDNVGVGPGFEGAFLPMLQSRFPALTSAPGKKNVTAFKRGKLDTASMDRPSQPIFTTELTGCSIVRMGNTVLHVRPHPDSDGTTLQGSFAREQSYGRKDYPDAMNSFVMLRKKSNGGIKLYYQTHHDEGASISGSRYLTGARRF